MLARIWPELRRYVWIEGRDSRREWWSVEALAIFGYWFIGTGAAVMAELRGEPELVPMQARLALSSLVFWINLASTVRRLHDRNKSGWWALAYAIPGIGLLWHIIECGFLPGRDKGNRYGRPQAPSALALWLNDPWGQIAKLADAPVAPAHTSCARRDAVVSARSARTMTSRSAPAMTPHAARASRTIGPAARSAVTRTRGPGKLAVIAAAAVALALLATSLLTLSVAPVKVNEDIPIFSD